MAKPFHFDVEPVSRFAALDAGIRRPKVCLAFLLLCLVLTNIQEIAYFLLR